MLNPADIRIHCREETLGFVLSLQTRDVLYSHEIIEDALVRIPIPPIYWQSNKTGDHALHREDIVKCFQDFKADRFRLTKLRYLELEGKLYSELTPYLKRRLDDTYFFCYEIYPGVPQDIVQDILRRLN